MNIWDIKRRQKRIPIRTEAKIIRVPSGEIIKGMLLEISCYGAGLRTKTLLKPNEIILISIIPHSHIQFMRSEEHHATVKWVKKEGNDYSVGIMFNGKMNEKGFPLFSRYSRRNF